MNQPTLQQQYREQVVPALMKKFGFDNPHQVPAIAKVTVNSGIDATADKSQVKYVTDEVAKITGQTPVVTRAKLSISNFKLREGHPVGVKVTLRGARMYHFLYKLINIALPCIRDFRGVPTKFDGCGNYTLGIADHSIFPEVSVESAAQSIGMDICITTTAETDEHGNELLGLLGMPYRRSAAGKTAGQAEATEPAPAS